MTVLGRLFGVEERSLNGYAPTTVPQWESTGKWGDGMVWTGYQAGGVSADSAMRLSAVFACLRLLSEAICTLPLDTFIRRDGTRQPYRPRPAYLSFQPEQGSRIDYLSQVMLSLLTDGNAFIATPRDSLGEPIDLVVLNPSLVQIDRVEGEVQYRLGGKPVDMPNDLMHIKGMTLPGQLRGLSPIAYARETIGLGLAAQRFGQSFFENGALPGAVIEAPNTMSDPAIKRFRETWNAGHQGVANSHRVGVLSEGAKLSKVSVAPNDAQFLECVVAETLVSMADGTLRRADALRPGDELLGWSDGLVPALVAAVAPMPASLVAKVTTASGRTLTTTLNHPYLAAKYRRSPGGRYQRPIAESAAWVPADKLAVGDYVRVGLGYEFKTDEMDREDGWAIGALLGDGHLREGGSVGFMKPDPSVIARLDAWLARHGAELAPAGKPDNYWVKTNTVGCRPSPLRAYLRSLGLLGHLSHQKEVPAQVLKAGSEAWIGLLSGLLDTDGTVTRDRDPQPRIVWDSTSRRLLESAQHLLALLGFKASVFAMPPSALTRHPSFQLVVCGREQTARLARTLDCVHARKAGRLNVMASCEPRGNGVRSDPNWDRVISIVVLPARETVGVEVEGVHTHVTNGFVTHNTRAFQVPDVARIFGVPPHLIADASNSTSWGSGLQEQNLAFGQYSLRPWIERIEDAHGRLLTTHGLPDVFVKLNLDALLRASLKDRYHSYAVGIANQFVLRNEARKLEDLPPLPGGDEFPEGAAPAPPVNTTGGM